MLEQFLHEQLKIAFNYGVPKPEMPSSITQNLNPAFELRDYQKEASDEAHHINVSTKSQQGMQLFESWETQ